jgi:hypothetical protein
VKRRNSAQAQPPRVTEFSLGGLLLVALGKRQQIRFDGRAKLMRLGKWRGAFLFSEFFLANSF